MIANYCVATLLAQFKPWINPKATTQWALLEYKMVGKQDMKALLLAAATGSPLFIEEFPFITASVAAWRKLLSLHSRGIKIQISQAPLQTFEYLIPDLSVKTWLEKGCSSLSDALVDPSCKDSYQMYQIKHFLKTPPSSSI